VPLPQLRRVRWAVRTTLTLGVAASVAANVLHARPNPISQAIAAWPPLALLLAVELISRVPMHRRSLAYARLLATAAIASIAAWVSYWHMAGVASRYGETGASAYLLPLSVDGLIVVASVCLVELAGRIREIEIEQRQHERAMAAAAAAAAVPAPVPPPAPTPTPTPPPNRAPVPVRAPEPVGAAMPHLSSLALPQRPVNGAPLNSAPMNGPARPTNGTALSGAAKQANDTSTRRTDLSTTQRRRPVAETAALAAEIEARHPNLTAAELAAQLGISTKRLQAIRREVRELQPAA
jgi:Protein of unknown function (DUF2637)